MRRLDIIKDKLKFGEKGTEPITALAAVLIVALLIFEAFVVTNWIVERSIARQTAREIAAIDVINAMDFLKRSMQEVVKHAAYKASYDVLERGGYYTIPNDISSLNCIPYWRKYSETIDYDKSIFEESLKSALIDVFNCYGGTYSTAYSREGISISTPSYPTCGGVEITNEGKFNIIIKSDCGSGLEVSKDFISVKESNANFEGEVVLNVIDLIENAKSKFIDDRPVLYAIKNAIDGFECKSITVEESDCSYGSMTEEEVGDALIEKSCSDWNSKLKTKIGNELREIKISEVDIDYLVEDIKASKTNAGCTSICEPISETIEEPTPTEPEPTEPESCSGVCVASPAECRSVCEGGYCTALSYECDICCCKCPAESESEQTEEPETTGEPETTIEETIKYRTTCSYNFKADANVIVTVRAEENTYGAYYPIYKSATGKTEWERLALRFRVLDGNLEVLEAKTNSCSQVKYC